MALIWGVDITRYITYSSYEKEVAMFSTKEAAEKMKLSQDRVRALEQAGVIPAKKLGHDWLVLGLTYKRRRKVKGVCWNNNRI